MTNNIVWPVSTKKNPIKDKCASKTIEVIWRGRIWESRTIKAFGPHIRRE